MKVSIIVPVYNGEKTLLKLVTEIRESLNKTFSYEIIFVHDFGTDNSWSVLKTIYSLDPEHIKIYRLNKNYGQHNATLYGFEKSTGELLVTIDEDLQHDPHFIPELLQRKLDGNYDLIYGRFLITYHSSLRRIMSSVLRTTLKYLISGSGYYSSYRLLNRDIAIKTANIKNPYTFIDGRLASLTKKISFVDISHRKNTNRNSSYNLVRLFIHSISILLAYTRIIQFVFFLSFLFIILVVNNYYFNFMGQGGMTGSFIAGLILLILGLTGTCFNYINLRKNTSPIISIESYG